MNNYEESRALAQNQYNKARSNLLWVVALTVVNIVLLVSGSGTMMLFSATVPYISATFAMACEDSTLFNIFALISGIGIASYFACWFFSKKHVAWLIVSAIFFALDSLALVGMYLLAKDLSGILDLIIHILILYYLISGVRYGLKLRKMPVADLKPEETVEENNILSGGANTMETLNSVPLYKADMTVKYRILLAVKTSGWQICYRRVKKTNELVVDGYVYDAVEMLIEPPHALTAKIEGHLIQAGNDGFRSYIKVDGETVLKKIRIW